MTQAVYITKSGHFLPNEPVGNDQIESVLGQVGSRPSRARAIVLRNNGIRTRHYAIHPETGAATHNNAALTALAVRSLAARDFDLDSIALLACGTSSPDQLMPNHAVMVHAALGCPPCETLAASGICVSGVMALKYGFLSVASGSANNAICTGSELASSFMRADSFAAERDQKIADLKRQPGLAFEKDFLRWMLSDGAGALLLERQPAQGRLSLKIEWVEQFSFANELQACMYAGAEKADNGELIGWREFASMDEVAARSVMSVKQDVRLLETGIRSSARKGFEAVLARHPMAADDVDYLLPHYSSEHFRQVMWEVMPPDWKIPQERWFTNLATRGNVGSASMYLMLDELLTSGKLVAGQTILCFVPESGRFSTAFVYLRVVEP